MSFHTKGAAIIFVTLCASSIVICQGGGGGGYGGGGGGGGYGGGGGGGSGSGYKEESYPPKPYDFAYAVNDPYSGANFGQQERSDGNKVLGEYRVQLPDGRLQIVTYNADWKNGFNADVKYQGEAKYPEPPKGGYGGGNAGNAGYASSGGGNAGNAGYASSGGGNAGYGTPTSGGYSG